MTSPFVRPTVVSLSGPPSDVGSSRKRVWVALLFSKKEGPVGDVYSHRHGHYCYDLMKVRRLFVVGEIGGRGGRLRVWRVAVVDRPRGFWGRSTVEKTNHHWYEVTNNLQDWQYRIHTSFPGPCRGRRRKDSPLVLRDEPYLWTPHPFTKGVYYNERSWGKGFKLLVSNFRK